MWDIKWVLGAYVLLVEVGASWGQGRNCVASEVCIPRGECRDTTRGPAANADCMEDFCGVGENGEIMVCCTGGPAPVLPRLCGRQPAAHANIRKDPVAPLGAYPWMALIRHKKSDTDVYHYSGSIINTRYVLTTGLALSKERPKDYLSSVILGATNISATEECIMGSGNHSQCFGHLVAGIEAMILHPKHDNDGKINDDIGLIRLNITLDFNDRSVLLEPVCVGGPADVSESRLPGILVGWTMALAGYGTSSKTWTALNATRTELLTLDSVAYCTQTYTYFDFNLATCAEREVPEGQADNTITYFLGGQFVVPTDSMRNYRLYAMWSGGRYDKKKNKQDLRLTLVDGYRSWIEQTAVP